MSMRFTPKYKISYPRESPVGMLNSLIFLMTCGSTFISTKKDNRYVNYLLMS